MARTGVATASTYAIAAEAGVPQSVFHYCFRSKAELLQQLTREVVESMASAGMTARDVPVGSDPETTLRAVMRGILDDAFTNPDEQRVLYELTTTVLHDDTTRDLARWQYEVYHVEMEKVLVAVARATNTTWTVDMSVLRRVTSTQVDGLILAWLADGDTEGAYAGLDQYAQLLATLMSPISDDNSES
jgi:AcrR family transcriptional regulator